SGNHIAGRAATAWPPVDPLFATSIDGCGLASHGICVVTVSAARPATPTIAIAHLSPVDIDVLEKRTPTARPPARTRRSARPRTAPLARQSRTCDRQPTR